MLTSRLMWVVTGALSWIQKQIYAHSLILKGQTLQDEKVCLAQT